MSLAHRDIYLVRHGITDWNAKFRYQGSSDIPLNAEGIKQAERTALRFSGFRPERIISSPLDRAFTTASVLAEKCKWTADIEVRDALREISFGKWEGLTVSEIRREFGDNYALWAKDPFSFFPDGGEPQTSVLSRARDISEELRNVEASSVVVAHGGILRALLACLIDSKDPGAFWRMRLDNCSISLVRVWKERPPYLMSLNDTHHLKVDESMIGMLRV